MSSPTLTSLILRAAAETATATASQIASSTVAAPYTTETCDDSGGALKAKPGKDGYLPPEACNSNWSYPPSFSAAVAFAIIFGMLTAGHISLAAVYKKTFCWVLIMGIVWETISFGSRAYSSKNQDQATPATVASLLFLLAPLWINAFAYMLLGRMIHYFLATPSTTTGIPLNPLRPREHHPHALGIKGSLLTRWFVLADVACFLIQATGGMMVSPGSSASTKKLGLSIYMAGVGVQQGFIVLFSVVAVRFHYHALQTERQGAMLPGRKGWRMILYTLYATLLLISIRIIFRLIEYSRGADTNNPILYHEWYQYAFDAVPMTLATLLLLIFHPGRVLKGRESEYKLTRGEKKEFKIQKKQAKRDKKAGKTFGGYEWAGTPRGEASRSPSPGDDEAMLGHQRGESHGMRYEQDRNAVEMDSRFLGAGASVQGPPGSYSPARSAGPVRSDGGIEYGTAVALPRAGV